MEGAFIHLRIPKEHGAWAMLYTPFAAGLAVSRSFSWALPLLLAAVTCLFIGRDSLLAWGRARSRGEPSGPALRETAFMLGLALACGIVAALVWRLPGLLWMGLTALLLLGVNFSQVVRREHRALEAEILGVVGLTLTAPAAYYAARGRWDAAALWLWLLSALCFASSIFYVRLRVLSPQPRKDQARQDLRVRSMAYHAFLVVVLGWFALTGRRHALAVLGFLPILGRTAWSLWRPSSSLDLRRIGILEIVYSVNFLVFIALAFSRG